MSVKTAYAQGDFCWVDLMTKDMDAATAFYTAVFGWVADEQPTSPGQPHYTIFRLNDQSLCGMGQMPANLAEAGMPPLWNSYIAVDDVTATVDRVEELGGNVTMPPMQVMEAGSMAGIQDPSGAHVFLWQKDRHFGAGLVNDPGAFCWNELATRDIPTATKFYGDLFGYEFEVDHNSPNVYHHIKVNGHQNGGVIQMDEKWGETPPHWMVYFNVADLNATLDKLKTAGGNVCIEPFEIPDLGPMTVVNDPQGATFSLIQLSQWD